MEFSPSNSSATTAQAGSVLIYGSNIINRNDATDEGAININPAGYQAGATKYRNFNVYNGKSASVPLFQVAGKTDTVHVNALFSVTNTGKGITLSNKTYLKTDKRLTNLFSWTDSKGEAIASIGYAAENSFDFTLKNSLGNIVVSPNGYLDIQGELKIGGTAIGSIYVTQTTFSTELGKKVTAVTGKQLSTEDFTKAYKDKLEAITTGSLTGVSAGGYVLASEVSTELAKKLSINKNLSDLQNKATARTNIGVYSKAETDTLLAGKLSTSAAYTGEVFTTAHKTKLEAIKTGNFQATGVNQTEGYVLVRAKRRLKRKKHSATNSMHQARKT